MMTKEFTFAHEPKGNKLSVTQVNDLCEKNSALIMKRTAAATYSCTDKQDPWREEVRLTSAKFTFFTLDRGFPRHIPSSASGCKSQARRKIIHERWWYQVYGYTKGYEK